MEMSNDLILLVEDNPDDEELTLRALQQSNILNEVVVARDGVEALDYLFATGALRRPRPPASCRRSMLLDLKLPQGRTAWRCCAGCAPTSARALLPVVILTSSTRGAGHRRRLQPRGQQLRAQAGRLRPVRRGGAAARALLAGAQRAAAAPGPSHDHSRRLAPRRHPAPRPDRRGLPRRRRDDAPGAAPRRLRPSPPSASSGRKS